MKRGTLPIWISVLSLALSLGLAAQTSNKTGTRTSGKTAAPVKKPAPSESYWWIRFDDSAPITTSDGTKSTITLHMLLISKDFLPGGGGWFTGDSTFSSAGTRAGFQASLDLKAKNFTVYLADTLVPGLAALNPTETSTKSKDKDSIPGLAPLAFPAVSHEFIGFNAHGRISYIWTQLRDSLMLNADNKPSQSDKDTFTFTYDYVLKTPEDNKNKIVLMTMIVAEGQKVVFSGKYGHRTG